MRARRSLAIATLLLLVAPPAALAEWTDHGQMEPNHAGDSTERMWREGSRDETRVVLNAYETAWPGGANLNTASLWLGSTRIQPAAMQWRATFGLWRDCNGDGGIGILDAGLAVYPPDLLDAAGAAACPEGGAHRVDGWVAELRPVGMVDPCEFETEDVRARDCPGIGAFERNPFVVYANGTKVWGDRGWMPEEGCRMWPLPPGTTSSTGRFLLYADCLLGGAVGRSVNTVDADGSLGLRFDDPERPDRGDSALDQELPLHPYRDPYDGSTGFLERGSDDAAFTVYDCDAGGETPDPRVHDPHGSLWDGAENAWEGALDDCDPSTRSEFAKRHPDLEPSMMVDPAPKSRHDVVFRFNDGHLHPWRPLLSRAPPHLGPAVALAGAVWESQVVRIDQPFVGFDGLERPQDWVFYGALGADALARDDAALPGGAGAEFRYGAEFCPEIGPGAQRTWWACDPERWWLAPAGSDAMPRYAQGAAVGARVGDPYHVRDMDCQDRTMGLPEPENVVDPRRCAAPAS